VDCSCNGTCSVITTVTNCGTCGNTCPLNMPICCTAREGSPFCSTQQQCNAYLLNGLVLPIPGKK
jgi:hypothetical protein